jgi:hypothetical protein
MAKIDSEWTEISVLWAEWVVERGQTAEGLAELEEAQQWAQTVLYGEERAEVLAKERKNKIDNAAP